MSPPLAILAALALGTIPSGPLFARLAGAPSPTREGSGATGATNVLRVAGVGAAVATLAADVGKGAAAAALAGEWGALAAVVGHVAGPWTGFRGGKGVAPALGAFLVLAPSAAAVSALVFLAVLAAGRIVSLASLAGAAALPAACVLLGSSRLAVAAAIVVAAVVLASHRGNLVRLREGREPRIGRGGGG